MKLLLFLLVCFPLFLSSQEITGEWYGKLSIQGTEIPIVIHVTKTESTYSSELDSPTQKAFGIKADSTFFTDPEFQFQVSKLKAKYSGKLTNQTITGVFTQNGMDIPLVFTREKSNLEKAKKPQDPIEPFPYFSENITVKNEVANLTLSGTLTKPTKKGNYPLVILISGSGPQNRDEELMGHKPFLVISDYLTRNGCAVFRYDDRGVAESTGDFRTATSFDFSKDVDCIVNYFSKRKDFKKSKIGLMGHSEGGLIAPIVASTNKEVDFIILLAGPGVSGAEILKLQSKLITKSQDPNWTDDGSSDKLYDGIVSIFAKNQDLNKCQAETRLFLNNLYKDSIESIEKSTGLSFDDFIESTTQELCSPWLKTFIITDAEDYLKTLKIPVLALNGSKDIQVDSHQNLLEIERILTENGNKNFKTIEIKNQNHLFQSCTSCTIEEYSKLSETFSFNTLNEIIQWLQYQNIIRD
ncbi:MAG: alpha/beta hydrolase family protein [Fluviicola sp.]